MATQIVFEIVKEVKNMSKKILSNSEIHNQTDAGKGVFPPYLCAQGLVLCNTFWPDFLKGFSKDAEPLGTLDCGTCTYMSEQCGWKYVYGGTGGGIAWEECKYICTCH